jgi:hypothetical protein
MALQNIKNYRVAMCEISLVLKSGGRFIFSIPHPCFELGKIGTDTNYFENSVDKVKWNMERLLKPFETTSFHRTLTQYIDALYAVRLLVRRLVEAQPTLQAVEKCTLLTQFLTRSHTAIFECLK